MCTKSHCRGARIVQSGHARDRGPKRREKSQKNKRSFAGCFFLMIKWERERKVSILSFTVSLKLLHPLDSLLYVVLKHWLQYSRKSNPVWSLWQNLEMKIIDVKIIAIVTALSPLALARAQFSMPEQQQPDLSNPYLPNDPNLLAIIPDTRPQPAPMVKEQQVNQIHLSTFFFFFLKSVRLSLQESGQLTWSGMIRVASQPIWKDMTESGVAVGPILLRFWITILLLRRMERRERDLGHRARKPADSFVALNGEICGRRWIFAVMEVCWS